MKTLETYLGQSKIKESWGVKFWFWHNFTKYLRKRKEKIKLKFQIIFYFILMWFFKNRVYYFCYCISSWFSFVWYFNRIIKAEKFANAHKCSSGIVSKCCGIHPVYVCMRAREDRTCFLKRLSVLFPLYLSISHLMMKVDHADLNFEWA